MPLAILCAILLAGEPLHVDAARAISFTENQRRGSAEPVRAGLVRWAATAHGRAIFDRFMTDEYAVIVREEPAEGGSGLAPQPGIATLAASDDRTQTKTYVIVLDPAPVTIPQGMTPLPNQPTTTADVMAAAWAAEMLHVSFYARGISLPHHQRSDFQEQWLAVAAELRMPSLTHGEEDDRESRRATMRVIGRQN